VASAGRERLPDDRVALLSPRARTHVGGTARARADSHRRTDPAVSSQEHDQKLQKCTVKSAGVHGRPHFVIYMQGVGSGFRRGGRGLAPHERRTAEREARATDSRRGARPGAEDGAS